MESNQDVLNRIYANFVGNAKSSFEQTEEDFAALRSALASTPCVDVDKMLNVLNTLGHQMIAKKDVYAYLMGDLTALNKYQGDPEPSDAPADVEGLIAELQENVAADSLMVDVANYLFSRNLIRTPDVWQTIDTAPRDGSEYMGVIEYLPNKFGKPFACFFDDDSDDHSCQGHRSIRVTDLVPHRPTHWTLPAPPIRTEPTDGGEK